MINLSCSINAVEKVEILSATRVQYVGNRGRERHYEKLRRRFSCEFWKHFAWPYADRRGK